MHVGVQVGLGWHSRLLLRLTRLSVGVLDVAGQQAACLARWPWV